MATATGLDVDAGGDSKLNGDLGSVSLNDILQMMGMAKRTGTIRVTFQGREGKIYLKDGEVLHAATGSVIGEGSIIGAGTLVPQGRVIPPRSLVVGTPGRVVREVTDEEYAAIIDSAERYVGYARKALR